jgi:hypothetical protein
MSIDVSGIAILNYGLFIYEKPGDFSLLRKKNQPIKGFF